MKIVKKDLSLALDYLKKGKVILSPTDTVYGLLGDATSEKTVERVFKIKKRSFEKPLPVFVGSIQQAKEFVFIDEKKEDFLKKYWPGKLTAVLKATEKGESLGEKIVKNDKIGVRIPNHDFILQVLKEFKKPLTSTSANISGSPEGCNFKEIISYFKEDMPDLAINEGNLKKSKPSTVIDFSNNSLKILRNGSLFISEN